MPFKQRTNLALERRTRDVGLAIKRVFYHRVIGAADAHFGVARANVKAGLENEGACELLDLR